MNNERFDYITARYLQGTATVEEEKELLAAIRSSAEFSETFRKKSRTYPGKENDSETDRKWNRIAGIIQAEASQEKSRKATLFSPSRRKAWLSVAAAILVVCVSSLAVFFVKQSPTPDVEKDRQWQILAAEADDRTCILPDGTSVYLRKGAVLRYADLTHAATRQVAICGEAFFDVTPDAKKPFIVDVSGLFVRVLGTSFSVSAWDKGEMISVILATGSVSLTDAHEKELVRLIPNQKVDYSLHSGQYTVTEVDSDRATSWRKGIVSYDNATLEEIVGLIEQTYAVSLQYTIPPHQTQRFSGAFFKKQKLETVLKLTGRLTGSELKVQE